MTTRAERAVADANATETGIFFPVALKAKVHLSQAGAYQTACGAKLHDGAAAYRVNPARVAPKECCAKCYPN